MFNDKFDINDFVINIQNNLVKQANLNKFAKVEQLKSALELLHSSATILDKLGMSKQADKIETIINKIVGKI